MENNNERPPLQNKKNVAVMGSVPSPPEQLINPSLFNTRGKPWKSKRIRRRIVEGKPSFFRISYFVLFCEYLVCSCARARVHMLVHVYVITDLPYLFMC